ncbi:MAG: phosphoribosylaminoimidazolesuccinocarboxamide synthase [Candidatus Eiseniibacteriota bacterium]
MNAFPAARDAGLATIEIPGVTPWRRGKVRDVYGAGDQLVVVASDRLSAYDSILPTPIPDKGRILTALSAHWFRTLRGARPHHLLSTERADLPEPFRSIEALEGRTMLCARAERVDVECVVRGYLTGAGYREYRTSGTLHGEKLPTGLADGARLDRPRFTPTTKAEEGHDLPIALADLPGVVGADLARELAFRSHALYEEAHDRALAAGLVLADTKLEFGFVDGKLTLIDELLSPDSSRYWDRSEYGRGRLVSFDKQYVRDWLDDSGWDHQPPAPALPAEVVTRTRDRYLEAARRLMGAEAEVLWR